MGLSSSNRARFRSKAGKLIEQGRIGGGKRMLMHVIEAEEFIRALSWSSRLNAVWDFLQHRYKMGRGRTDQWLSANFDRIGTEVDTVRRDGGALPTALSQNTPFRQSRQSANARTV